MRILSYLQSGQFSEDMIPTVGFNMRKVSKGNVTIKVSWLATWEFLLGIMELGNFAATQNLFTV